MGCGPSKPKLKRVVIIGGGYSGAYLAYLLKSENFCDVTLIDPKDSFLHRIAIPRCVVEPDFLKKAFIPYKSFLNCHLQSEVSAINRKKSCVELTNGKKVSFDFLVISTGRDSGFPLTLNDVQTNLNLQESISCYKDINNEMKSSPEIVLIGGSQFGVELAGEIRTDYPDKKISIIHNGINLISNQIPEELQKELKDTLDRKEVDLYLNTNLSNRNDVVFNKYTKDQKLKMTDDKEIVADLVIDCNQSSFSTGICKKSQMELSLDSSGAVIVDEYLRVKDCAGMYAMGDVSAIKCEKTEENSKAQAYTVYANIRASCLMDPELHSFHPETQPILITIGRYSGVGYAKGNLLNEFDVLDLKCKDLFSDKIWNDFGLLAPEL